MNSLTRHVFTWCWLLLALAFGIRAESALIYIDSAHLNAEPSLCRRAGVPVHPTGCVMQARLGWQFPWGEMRVSPLEVDPSASTITVTPVEQRSLSYVYQPSSYHVSGGTPASILVFLVFALIGLLPSLANLRRFHHVLPWT